MDKQNELYSPDHVFAEMAYENLAQSVKLGEIYHKAKQALQMQTKVRVSTKINEKFKGFVANITDKEDGQIINFVNCELDTLDLTTSRSYYTHDIDEMSTCAESDNSDFEVEGCPNNQLGLQMIQTPQQSPSNSDDMLDSQMNTQHPDYPLPVQSDNETVDIDLLKLKEYPGEHVIPFQEWCDTQHIHSQMVKKHLFFGLNDEFAKIKAKNPILAITLYQIWAATFQRHIMPFNDWLKSPEMPRVQKPYPPHPADCTLDLVSLHLKAFETAEQAPRKDRTMFHKLRYFWADSLCRQHFLSFAEWLESPLRPRDSNVAIYKSDESKIHTMADIKPFDSLFYFNSDYALRDKENQTVFVLDQKLREHFEKSDSYPEPEMFLPNGIFAKMHIPNYILIPYGVTGFFKLDSMKHVVHVQQTIWSRLHEAQYEAYTQNSEQWTTYFNDHPALHKTPLILRFLQQQPSDRPQISIRQVVQQMQAHERCRIAGGPQNLDKDEFYDLFFRPLEFMVARGMPLHATMIASIHCLKSRCHLARQIIEIAGFSIHEPIPVNLHFLYSEMSRVRHLEAHTLIPLESGYLTPTARLDGMPKITNIFQTRKMQGEIDVKDFNPQGRLHNFQPQPFSPLPDHILDSFKKIGGRTMSLCDHVALIHEITRFHKMYVQTKTKPVPMPRKNKPPRVIKYVDESTSNSDSSDTAKTVIRAPKATKSPDLMDTSDPPQNDPEPITDWNSPELIPSSQPETKPEPPQVESEKPKNTTHKLDLPEKLPRAPTPQQTSATTCAPQLIHMTIEQLQQLIQIKQNEQKQKLLQEQDSQGAECSPHLSPLSNTFFKDTSKKTHVSESDSQQSPVLPTGPPPKAPSGPPPTYPKPRYHPSISTRPQWVTDIRDQIDEKVFSSSLNWSCTHHYKTPAWAKIAHSAWSLYQIVDKDAPQPQAVFARYREMPNFRQIPADGLNHLHNVTVLFEREYNEERVVFKNSSQTYHSSANSKRVSLDKPATQSISIPSNIFNRFIIQFYDIADTQLRPAYQDVQQGGHNLFHKQCFILDYHLTYSIYVSEGRNGLERVVRLQIQKGNLSKKMLATSITFPWVRMGAILVAMREVLADMQQQGLL